MSSPWAWFGNEFPSVQGVLSMSATGDGTDYQILWNMNDWATTDDQICKFEWTAKELTLSIAGSVTLPFFVASTSTTEDHTTPFSKTLTFNINTATSTWDGNEVPNGSDYPTSSGCALFSLTNTFSIPVTLSDGSTSGFGFSIGVILGASFAGTAGLFGIAETLVGRIYGQYTKEVGVSLVVNSNTASDNIIMLLNKSSLPGPGAIVPLGAQTVFHSTALAYWTAPNVDGSTLSLSAFTLLVTASSTTPPNI